MLAGKFLDPKNDFLFKKLFGTIQNQELLIAFLNDVLGHQTPSSMIASVSFLKPFLEPDALAVKQSIVDVLCQDESGKQYIIEMQVAHSASFVKRAQFYAARAYSSQLLSGEAYNKLHEIIFIAITDFVMFPKKEQWKSDHVILDNLSGERDLKDFYFSFIELPKFNLTIDDLTTRLEKWIYFIKHAEDASESEMERLVSGEQVLMQASTEVNRYNMTEIEMNTYEAQLKSFRDGKAILEGSFNLGMEAGELKGKAEGKAEGMAQGKAEGMAQGKAEGIAKGKGEERLQIAKNLKLAGLSLEMICQATNLSREEMEGLWL